MNTSQLTFTRFIAATLIVFFHYHNGIFTTNIHFIESIKSHLNLGVSYFYVLSDFVMMLAYGNKHLISAKEYYVNRFARIYPLHIFSFILVIIVSILISINYLEYYNFPKTSIILQYIFLIQSWFPQNALSINTASWSISVEFFFYVCFPFLFNYFIKKYSIRKITFYILSFWLLSQIIFNWFYFSPYYTEEAVTGYSIEHMFLYFNPILHLNQFCIGLLFGKYCITYYHKHKGNYNWAIVLLFIFTCILVYVLRDIFLHNGLIAINFAILIYLISINESRITQFFRKKVFIHLGEISFAMYLLQQPIYDICKKIFKITIDTIQYERYFLFLFSFIVLIISSHFTYKWIEIPLKNKIKQLFR